MFGHLRWKITVTETIHDSGRLLPLLTDCELLPSKLKEWCWANCDGGWESQVIRVGWGNPVEVTSTFFFEDETDAALFKLMWC